MTDEDDVLAAEFALGLLDDADAAAVQARARTDGPLSLRIAWWRDQLAPLANEMATPAPAGVWKRIEAQLPGNDNNATLMQRWRAAAILAMSVAAALLIFIGMKPADRPVVLPRVAAPLMAALSGEKGSVVAIGYEVGTGKLTVAPTTLDPGQGDAELWIIPEGGKPLSLGVIDATQVRPHVVPAAMRELIAPGATFAISQEAKGGSVTGAPSSHVVASGKIFRT